LLLEEEQGNRSVNQDGSVNALLDEKDPARLDKMKKVMINKAKQELNEHNDALAHFIEPADEKGKKARRKWHGKKRTGDNSEDEIDTDEGLEESTHMDGGNMGRSGRKGKGASINKRSKRGRE